MNEHDDACVDAMLMVNMQANTRSVAESMSHHGISWMWLDRASVEWQQGLSEYLDSTFAGSSKG